MLSVEYECHGRVLGLVNVPKWKYVPRGRR